MDLHTRTLAVNSVPSPLGRIPLAGVIRDAQGIPFSNMRTLGSYAMVYIVEGGGRYLDANRINQAVKPGDLIFLFPEIPHAYGPANNRPQRGCWTEIYAVFEGPAFDLFRRHGLLDPKQPIRRAEPLEYWFRRIEAAALGADASAADSLLAVCRLQQVLAELLSPRGNPSTQTDADRIWLARAKAALDGHLSPDASLLESAAASLGLSYVAFRKRFTKLAGLPPAKYRAKVIMDLACTLIRSQGSSNKQIASQCGFHDEFHFSRRFKQVVGLSPKEFRRQVPRDSNSDSPMPSTTD